ncbi:MAG: glycosyltransferase family 2 protein [Reyranella sp.]|uniref:glycosyltransferase family 2 protein n=1 Tax=Reyranella sp. TaxID=1929291 RepID=UPI0027311AE4|nr:glycosyltransferase family 2 protein [Reyranella sp.]MDP1967475.1 glycosyltransferase family 2 protein [Reyranella sp.]MDP2376453.1 glycosyltransferase family 2 protein [Reyranella sp.]
MIDISVVIPTYNRLWSLPNAVQSCLATAAKVEVIVVDNGSTDGTWEWLQQQPGVRAIRMDNWGKDWAVVEALKVAQGEYVRFLDSDDWLAEGANDEQLRLARNEAADVVVAGYQDFDDAANTLHALTWVDCDDFIAQQLGEGWSSHYSAFLFRRDFIADIPHRQDFAFIDDRMFMIEVALKKPRLAVYRKPAFIHRRHGRGRLQDSRGIVKTVATWQQLTVYRKAFAMLGAAGELSPRRKRAPLRVVWSLMRELAKTHPAEAAAVYDWIHELDPTFAAPIRRSLALAYRTLGFRRTERLVNLRARLLGRP